MWASTLPAMSSAAPWPTTTTGSTGVLIGLQVYRQEVSVSTTGRAFRQQSWCIDRRWAFRQQGGHIDNRAGVSTGDRHIDNRAGISTGGRHIEGGCIDRRRVYRQQDRSAIDAKFLYQYGLRPKSLHKCIWAKPHHPKKQSIAVVPGLVRISNRVFWVGG
jgi:hypothetical protein